MVHPTLAKPTVHLNGTSRKELHDGYMKARAAALAALTPLAASYPNARDYYVQQDGDYAFRQAMAQHEARMSAMRRIIEELEELAEATMEK